jgi:hypothetical protein
MLSKGFAHIGWFRAHVRLQILCWSYSSSEDCWIQVFFSSSRLLFVG